MSDSGIDVFISHDDLIELSPDYRNECNSISEYESFNDRPNFAIEAMEYNPMNIHGNIMFENYDDSYTYTFVIDPEQHQPSGSHNITFGLNSEGYHTYSFAIYPEEHEPSGTANMSYISQIPIEFCTSSITS